MLIICMPVLVSTGRMKFSPPRAPSCTPKSWGMEGPVMSASSTRAPVAAALHLAGEQAGDEALAYAALAADNGNDAADGSALVQGLEKALLAALAVFAAGGAVVIAIFAHYFYLFCKQ